MNGRDSGKDINEIMKKSKNKDYLARIKHI